MTAFMWCNSASLIIDRQASHHLPQLEFIERRDDKGT